MQGMQALNPLASTCIVHACLLYIRIYLHAYLLYIRSNTIHCRMSIPVFDTVIPVT